MPKKKAIIFDLWDTLIYNNDKDTVFALISQIVKINYERKNWKRVESVFMRKRYKDTLSAARDIAAQLSINNPILIGAIANICANHIKPKLFPDVIPVLKELKDYRLGIISNTPCFGLDSLEAFFKRFDVVSLSCETGILKPDPEIFFSTLNSLNAEPEEAIMVGDNYFDDIAAAINIGMDAVMIRRPSSKITWHEKKRYSKTISSLKELCRYLNRQ